MALTKHPVSITVDTPPREQSMNVPPQTLALKPVIELWYGDITASGAFTKEDILVLSSKPSKTLIGNSNILKWGQTFMSPSPKKWFSSDPCINADIYFTNPSIIDNILFWEPSLGPLSQEESAPYKTDDIFIAAQAMWGHIPKSIMIPLHIGDNGFCNSTIMLQSLLHSALKYAGWRDYIPTTIKIVLDKSDTTAFTAFDTIAKNYDTLRGAPNKGVGTTPPTGFPTGMSSYGTFMGESNEWMSNMYSSVKNLNPITEFQVFALNIYTSSYFTPIQEALRKPLSNNAILPLAGTGTMPSWYGAGFTDLGNPNYQALIPLYATMSAGLLNISAYHGTTYRGTGKFSPSWDPFIVGQGFRLISYMSSADQFYGAGLPWPKTRFRDEEGRKFKTATSTTPSPWNNDNHIRTISLTARNISPYSMHQYEREHLYDYEFLEYVTSKDAGGKLPPGAGSLDNNIATIQVTDSILPLFK